ncbi:MAG: hypothetical protein ACW99G_00455 [Candidatus Thorarchaeota archaeon]|jgi:hypothetical protein
MKKIILGILFLAICTIGVILKPQIQEFYYASLSADTNEEAYQTTYVAPYVSDQSEKVENLEIQCPIPKEDRVRNHTGIQCVFSSIEMLGRWAEEPKLTNPPITSRNNCKGYSSPSDAASKLRKLGVKFEQSYGDRKEGIKIIKKAMSEGRGCLIGVPGHAMVLVHYDDKADVVKWVDNSDRKLRIQTTTISGFHKMWRSWVLVIYADVDVIPTKLGRFSRQIPIINLNGDKEDLPDDFIPLPRRAA